MLNFTLKLLLAHVLGDFVFQPDKWVKNKKQFKLKSPFLYVHILVHALTLLLIFQIDLTYWIGYTVILVSHFLIDVGKLYTSKIMNQRWLFFIDQALHLIVIAGVGGMYYPVRFNIKTIDTPENILLLLFILLVTSVTSIVMKVLISKWNPIVENESSLPNAGAYIGILERLFIFGFVLIGFWEGIGFLLAAKSVFRFGDLSKSRDRNLTEYILIGTLLSFGIAILLGVLYNYLIIVLAAR